MAGKKLGRGLDALLSNSTATAEENSQAKNAENGVIKVELAKLFPTQYQPREGFDEEKLRELAKSIEENGIIQPIVARKHSEGYEIIAGERRWRASHMAGLKEVPVIVSDIAENKILELALIENIQREDLNPIELAMGLNELIEDMGLSQEEISERVGMSRSSVANYLRLLELSDEVKENVSRETITMGHARALLSVTKKEEQLSLLEKIIREKLSVRELEVIIKQRRKVPETSKKIIPASKSPEILALEDRLRKSMGTKVLVQDKKGRGKIVIEYYSLDEFDRILSIIDHQR